MSQDLYDTFLLQCQKEPHNDPGSSMDTWNQKAEHYKAKIQSGYICPWIMHGTKIVSESVRLLPQNLKTGSAGLENSTRLLVFRSASGCRGM